MAIDEAAIKVLVREETGQPTTKEVSDGILDAAFLEAARDVNRRLANYDKRIGSITTEAEKQEYDLPDDCIRVVRLYWGPSIPTVTPTSRLHRRRFGFVALEYGEELQAARQRKLDKFPYTWDVLDSGEGRKLVLGSVPTVGGKIIKFVYRAASSDASVIPDALGEALKEHMKWTVFRVRYAYWTTNEGITMDAELRSQRAGNFSELSEQSEKRYYQILRERAGV